MLKAFQNRPLEESRDNVRGGYFAFVEASKESSTSVTALVQPTIKHLKETEVDDWALQRGSFLPLVNPPSNNEVSRIRILFAEPESTFRHAIPETLARRTVLQALNLPQHTFSSFQVDSGIYSSHCLPEGTTIAKCTSLAFVFRTPQLRDCTIGGLSVSYDFNSRVTTALILGYAFDLKTFHQKPTGTPPAALTQFVNQFAHCNSCWGHPLLLPLVFLVEHAQRVQRYAMGPLSRRVVLVEHSVGVTKTGRSGTVEFDFPDDWEYANDQKLFDGEQMQRQNAKRLVATINDLSTTIIFAHRSPQWDIATIEFLAKILEHERLRNFGEEVINSFKETLEYLRSYCDASSDLVRSSTARVQLQLNILYTSIAQDDGQTSARLALFSGKDSTSMKIIALITAAYLPGTFVATLFSVNMFDWQSNTVTPSFWVYWAVAVPLTIITISGWAAWWSVEMKRFAQDERQATTNALRSRRQNMYRCW